jgi:hypothetical protein
MSLRREGSEASGAAPAEGAAFSLWLYGGDREQVAQAATELANALQDRGVACELVDTAKEAREAYRSHREGLEEESLGVRFGRRARRLNREGTVVLFQGSRHPGETIGWGRERPEHMLDVRCGTPDPEQPPVQSNRVPRLPLAGPGKQGRWEVQPLLEALERAGWLPAPSP